MPDVVAAAASLIARLLKADAILVPTRTGNTAIKMAQFRPHQPILAVSTNPLTVGRLTLGWGIWPLLGLEVPSHEDMIREAERVGVDAWMVTEGDLVVITAGFPVGGPGSTNTVTVKRIGEGLSHGGWGDEDQQSLFDRARTHECPRRFAVATRDGRLTSIDDEGTLMADEGVQRGQPGHSPGNRHVVRVHRGLHQGDLPAQQE